MEKVYVIRHMSEQLDAYPLSGEFCPDCLPEEYKMLEEAKLDSFPWDVNGYKPDCRARVGWNKKGLHVLMYANEPSIRAEMEGVGSIVCTDSCLEFFMSPVEGNEAYFNCEVNPRPTVHLGLGASRQGRTVLHELPEGMNPTASVHQGGWWAVSYTIPAALLKEYFGAELKSGQKLRGNFYKCADRYEYPHYGMFKPYDLPAADYHRPEMFAEFDVE